MAARQHVINTKSEKWARTVLDIMFQGTSDCFKQEPRIGPPSEDRRGCDQPGPREARSESHSETHVSFSYLINILNQPARPAGSGIEQPRVQRFSVLAKRYSMLHGPHVGRGGVAGWGDTDQVGCCADPDRGTVRYANELRPRGTGLNARLVFQS